MMRFLSGLIVGAALVIAVQYLYAPLPSRPDNHGISEDPTADALQVPITESPRSSSARTPDAGATTPISRAVSPAGLRQGTGRRTASETDDPASPDAGASNPIVLPETHAGFVSEKPPALPDAHAELEREDVDSSWAELVERLIATHIASHPLGQPIALVALHCRTTRCEIAGTVYGEGGAETWDTVLASMQEQAWYAAYFSPSRLGSGASFPGEYRFVTILARVGTEIPPPVEQ